MTFPYSTTIPATNNDPADDQPLIQQNFASISQLIEIDHVGFSGPNAGTHQRVTFPNNNTPTVPTAIVGGNSIGTLFTAAGLGNINQLFYYAGGTNTTSDQYKLAMNGSTFLFGGIIAKWGGTGAIGDNGSVSFASAFPNNCFVVQLTITDPNATSKTINIKGSPNTSGFTVRVSSGVVSAFYLAIGN